MENRKSQKGKIIVIAVLAIAVLAAVGVFAFKGAGVKLKYGVDAYNAVSKYFNQPQYSMAIAVNTLDGESGFSTEAELYKNILEDKEITTLVWNGMTAHYCDEKLYFENGTVFEAEDVFDEFKKLVYKIGDIYKSVDVSKQEAHGTVQYEVNVSDKELFANIIAMTGITASEKVPDIRITVMVENDNLSSINFYADNAHTQQKEFVVDMTAMDCNYEIPADTAQMIISGDVQNTIKLSDMQLLAKAWENYFAYPVYGADIEIDVDCAFFNFDEEFTMLSMKDNGKDVTCIKRNKLELFIVDGQLYTERWGKLTDIETKIFSNAEKIVKICYQLCLSNNFEISTVNKKTTYGITMTEEEFTQFLQAVTDRSDVDISFDHGYLGFEVVDGSIKNMEFECDGRIDAVISEIGLEVDINIDFYESSADKIDLPQSIK